jgi:riboflavin kinase/FMN adenylyltransferase
MIVLRDGDTLAGSTRSVLAIGVFDGLHLGHQKVIASVKDLALLYDALSVVVTFDPHPALVLSPEHAPHLIGTLDQRLEGLSALGVDVVRILTFDETLAHEGASDFVARVLVRELRAVAVVVGQDFQFGHDRAGNVALLTSIGEQSGFEVDPAPIYGEPQRWSSTTVRRALADGAVEQAGAALGRPFVLRGTIEHGDARGADLGFPTANMALGTNQAVPEVAIYAGAARTSDRQWHAAAISIGTRPQFYDDGPLLVEVHLPGFAGNLYDETLDVAFLRRLRGEMTFEDVAALVTQIASDVNETVAIFKKFSPEESLLLE